MRAWVKHLRWHGTPICRVTRDTMVLLRGHLVSLMIGWRIHNPSPRTPPTTTTTHTHTVTPPPYSPECSSAPVRHFARFAH